MKKTTFWILMVMAAAILFISVCGVCHDRPGLIAAVPVCLGMIFLDCALYAASKNLDRYAGYTKQLEAENEELKKAISAKDEAIASYKWQIEALKKKIR